jgi:hypothetical protein
LCSILLLRPADFSFNGPPGVSRRKHVREATQHS